MVLMVRIFVDEPTTVIRYAIGLIKNMSIGNIHC